MSTENSINRYRESRKRVFSVDYNQETPCGELITWGFNKQIKAQLVDGVAKLYLPSSFSTPLSLKRIPSGIDCHGEFINVFFLSAHNKIDWILKSIYLTLLENNISGGDELPLSKIKNKTYYSLYDRNFYHLIEEDKSIYELMGLKNKEYSKFFLENMAISYTLFLYFDEDINKSIEMAIHPSWESYIRGETL